MKLRIKRYIRNLSIIQLFILISFQLFGQISFENTISRDEDQRIHQVIEDDDGNFIMVGRILDLETGFPSGYILQIDDAGNVLNEEIYEISDTLGFMFFNIHFLDNYYYLLGSHNHMLWYLKLNKGLEIQSENILEIPEEYWFSYMNSIIDSDSNFIITGYTTRLDTSGSTPYNNDPFFYKLSLEGDSITSKFMKLDINLTMSFDLIEKPDNSGYFAYGFEYSSLLPFPGQRWDLSKQFDSLDMDVVPYMVHSYYSPTMLSDTSILLCGAGGHPDSVAPYSLNVLSTTIENLPIHYSGFKIEGNMRDFPSFYQGVSKNGENIYIGGTSNFDYANPFLSTLDSWFHLIKINPDISPIWEYWYGGDAYYHLYSIIATTDGGCLMVGNRYDYEIQNQQRDIYVAKVNSDGLITWTQEIPLDNALTKVYPNPGTDQINIKTSINYANFELINISGQVAIRHKLDENQDAINTESLKSGMYFYRLIDKKNKTIETGKWIKK